MHVRPLTLVSGILVAALAATSQVPETRATPGDPSGIIRRPDGGSNGAIMQSLFIPPKAGAPFTMTLSSEWTRPLGNGGTWTLVNERRIARDTKGRIYQERWILVPKGGQVKSWMNVFQITDPEQHIWLNCEVKTKICEMLQYTLITEAVYLPPTLPSGPMPGGIGSRLHQDLGESSTLGILTHGFRDTATINAGAMGNDGPMISMREFWFSPELGFNLVSIVDDVQSGKQVFTVKEISTGEPNQSYFEIPSDYKVVDHRYEKTTDQDPAPTAR